VPTPSPEQNRRLTCIRGRAHSTHFIRESIRSGLRQRKLQSIAKLLESFEGNKWVNGAVKARNLFVHRYREECAWSQLFPQNRFQEPDDPMARTIRRIDQATDLDRYAGAKIADLSKMLEVVRAFRDKVFKAFQENLLRLARDVAGR
jgi:hypothetical protein